MKIFRSILAGGAYRDRLIAGVGAMIGIGITASVSALFPYDIRDMPFIVAPLGASAVLVFAVPASPMAQPWAVIGGCVISSLFGVFAFHAIPDIRLAAGVAVGGAIALMALFRCLHPPGGATALTAVVGGNSIHDASYSFAFAPVGLNAVLLVLTAMMFHRFTEHSYPHRAAPIIPLPPIPRIMPEISDEDVEAALIEADESFDISRDDIKSLLNSAQRHAVERMAEK